MNKKYDLKKAKDLPWSFVMKAEDITKTPEKVSLSANDTERQSLCNFLGLLSLDILDAELTVIREHSGFLIHVSGTLYAKVTQECVVSGDPVQSEINEEFESFYSDPDQAIPFAKAKNELFVSHGFVETPVLNEREDPEPVVNGRVDLADLVTQYFSLSLPSYPRAEGVEYDKKEDETKRTPSPIRKNPFEALKQLRSLQEKE